LTARPPTRFEAGTLELDPGEWVVQVLRASYSSEDTPVHTRETICGDPARPSHRAGRRRRRVLGLVRCPDNFGEMLLVNLRKRRLAQRSAEPGQPLPGPGGPNAAQLVDLLSSADAPVVSPSG
jgi:hypothetical protein